MELAYEGNTSLAFDTVALRGYGKKYGIVASELRAMAAKLDDCLRELSESGWTTPAGSAMHKMAGTDWNTNIKKYADLLDTLKEILDQAADQYDELTDGYIEATKL